MGDGELQPGFMVVHGNRLEDLRELATEWMKRHPLAPLENETILVQSNGIAQWLKLALAENPREDGGGCGIAAALDVQLPARFLWRAYRTVLGPGQVPEQSPFDRQRLTWRLMRLLPERLAEDEFAPLRRFLDGDGDQLRKRHQLCERLADLFDQYQVYRADWLRDWEQGNDRLRTARGAVLPVEPEQRWQPALWRSVLGDVEEPLRRDNRADVHRRFMKQAVELTTRPEGLPRRVIVFGISSLPSQFLEALEAVARVSQLLLCVHNPCEFYWADIVADKDLLRAERRRQPRREGMPVTLNEDEMHLHAHPLLATWGKQGRDYIRLLDEHDEPEHYRALFEDLPWQRIDLFRSHGDDTLLKQLQDDIRSLRPLEETRGQWPAVEPERDESIRFHVAHSPQREVEILHDQLLAGFSAHADLRPRDVIVMVPDIETYAPHIQAVFGQMDPLDPRYIPFTVADQGQRNSNPLLIALERLLRLPESRLAVSDLLDLLDVPAVRGRFGLTETDLPVLHRWVEGAGIRWGLDGEQRRCLGLPAGLEQNTWRFGLRRMLLGYASGSAEAWKDIEPYDEIGGLDAAMVGPLVELVDALDAALGALSAPTSPADWGRRLRDLLETFFDPADAGDALTVETLLASLEAWEEACADARMDEALPLTVVRETWLAAAEEQSLSQRFLAGSVNFCTLMPMRAIPFRMVCLLGMNDGDYPRAIPPLDFDLMATDYRPGDRSRREDDRYLFLEAVLSARRMLYVSWIGRGVRDNAERPPSVLVGQLRDHLAAGWRMADKNAAGEPADGGALLNALTREHPLQPFSRAYFPSAGREGALFTFAREWRQVHERAHREGGEQPLPPPVREQPLSVAELAAFLRNPAQAFFNQRLQVYLEDDRTHSEDLETFALDALGEWQLRERLVAAVLEHALEPDRATAVLQAEAGRLERSGALPMGGPGMPVRQDLCASVEAFLAHYRMVLEACPQRQDAVLALRYRHDALVVEDWLDGLHVQEDGSLAVIHPRAGAVARKRRLRYHNLVRPWVEHLVANACGHGVTTLVVGIDGWVSLAPLDCEPARSHLDSLLEAWRDGMSAPLGTACKTGFAWLEKIEKGEERALEAARQAYEGSGRQYGGERSESVYLARAWPDAARLLKDPGFRERIDALYRPLFKLAVLVEADTDTIRGGEGA